jgi:hypothetical protein
MLALVEFSSILVTGVAPTCVNALFKISVLDAILSFKKLGEMAKQASPPI